MNLQMKRIDAKEALEVYACSRRNQTEGKRVLVAMFFFQGTEN